MRLPYAGGYFSSIITSLLYELEEIATIGEPTTGVLNSAQLFQIPIEPAGSLTTGDIGSIVLLTVLAPVPYSNFEASGAISTGTINSINLVTTIVFVTYNNTEAAGAISTGTINSINLV